MLPVDGHFGCHLPRCASMIENKYVYVDAILASWVDTKPDFLRAMCSW